METNSLLMLKQILFIQGAGEGAHDADQKLVGNLRLALNHDEYEIYYPQMPDEHAPDYEPWKEAILKAISELEGELIVVGHSLGGSLVLKCLAEEKVQHPIMGIFILAAPFWGGDADWQYEGFELSKDFGAQIPSSPFFIYHNTDDQIVSSTHAKMYADKLPEAKVCVRGTGGHQFENGMRDVADDMLGLYQ